MVAHDACASKAKFTRKTDADSWLAKTRHDRDRGLTVDLSSPVTVAEYFTQWIEDRVVRDGTRAMYLSILRQHVQDEPLGSRPLVRVRPSEVQSWARSRTGMLYPATLNHYTGILRSVFASALLDGLIARNPVVRLSLPREEKREIVPLTVAQVRAWADCADVRVAPMIRTQAGLGLRVSELRALRVQDVDFLRRVVHITAQLHKETTQRVPLKTANSRRDVPLPAMVADVLASHIRPGQTGLIFTRDGASHWSSAVAGRRYKRAAEAAGLPPGTTSHSLRHHYVSVLLDAGESVHAVAARIGDSPQMVLQVYGHMLPDTEDRTRRAVDAAWTVTRTAAEQG